MEMSELLSFVRAEVARRKAARVEAEHRRHARWMEGQEARAPLALMMALHALLCAAVRGLSHELTFGGADESSVAGLRVNPEGRVFPCGAQGNELDETAADWLSRARVEDARAMVLSAASRSVVSVLRGGSSLRTHAEVEEAEEVARHALSARLSELHAEEKARVVQQSLPATSRAALALLPERLLSEQLGLRHADLLPDLARLRHADLLLAVEAAGGPSALERLPADVRGPFDRALDKPNSL